jgi:hypothetical protein
MKKNLTLSIDEKILARALVESFLLQFIKENP